MSGVYLRHLGRYLLLFLWLLGMLSLVGILVMGTGALADLNHAPAIEILKILGRFGQDMLGPMAPSAAILAHFMAFHLGKRRGENLALESSGIALHRLALIGAGGALLLGFAFSLAEIHPLPPLSQSQRPLALKVDGDILSASALNPSDGALEQLQWLRFKDGAFHQAVQSPRALWNGKRWIAQRVEIHPAVEAAARKNDVGIPVSQRLQRLPLPADLPDPAILTALARYDDPALMAKWGVDQQSDERKAQSRWVLCLLLPAMALWGWALARLSPRLWLMGPLALSLGLIQMLALALWWRYGSGAAPFLWLFALGEGLLALLLVFAKNPIPLKKS